MIKNSKKILTVLILIISIFTLTACKKTMTVTEDSISSEDVSKIIGEWKNNDLGYDFIYTFDKSGSGNYNANGTDMPFTYKIKGNNLSILYKGDTVSFDTTFEINGDTLNIKDSLGEDTLYKKVQ